jgi:hypothetical protein
MQISIYETVHFENIGALIRLFDQPGNQITVFCDEIAARQAAADLQGDYDRFIWVTRQPPMGRRRFILHMRAHIRKRGCDLVWLNTVSDNFIHLAWMASSFPQTRFVVTLHAIEAYFSPQLKFNLRRIIRVAGKWLLRRTIREYSVQSPTLLPAARRNLHPRYPLHLVPGAIYEPGKFEIDPTLPLNLVVAGSVDPRRRNYEELNQLISSLEQAAIPIRITVLGSTESAFGRSQRDYWRSLRLEHVNLKWYETELVEQAEYDDVLAHAHFIFHPSASESVLEDGAKEVYGATISSGVFSDAIRHAKPMILPSFLTIDPLFNSCCLQYQQAGDLLPFFRMMQDEPSSYQSWKEAALRMAEQFTVERIRQHNPTLFGSPNNAASPA